MAITAVQALCSRIKKRLVRLSIHEVLARGTSTSAVSVVGVFRGSVAMSSLSYTIDEVCGVVREPVALFPIIWRPEQLRIGIRVSNP